MTLSCGEFPGFGPMGGGVWNNLGISMLFRIFHTSGTESASASASASASEGSSPPVNGQHLDVAVLSNNAQLLDISQITSLGLQPQYLTTIAVKSKHHFRASLASMASQIACVDGGGLGSVILKGGKYEHVRRPIWPLDDI